MYNHLRGILLEKRHNKVILDIAGIGYEVHVPLSVSAKLNKMGSEVTILTHLIVREDEMRLIGFINEDERSLFRKLIELSGVGPALALQILSSVTPQDFALAIERQDAAFLKKIKGVGEKTAKRIILELKGAKMLLQPDAAKDLPEGNGADAAAALSTLGLPLNEAVARVEKALAEKPDATVEELIKAALRG